MSSSFGAGLGAAIIAFWAVGAYNRLVRLRAGAIEAFAALDTQFRLCLALVPRQPAAADEGWPPALDGLLGAAEQLEGSLRAARARPLDGLSVRALAAALATLEQCWERLCAAPPDLAGAPLPDPLRQQWRVTAQQLDAARDAFNLRVLDYNEAIAMWPARPLARLLRLRAAHTL